MLIFAVAEPPELFAQIVNVVLFILSVGIPQIVPLSLPKLNPLGKPSLMPHSRIIPGPLSVGPSGREGLCVLLSRVRFSGMYDSVGSWSTTVMFR